MHATRPINGVPEAGTTFTSQIDHHVANARRIRAEAMRQAGQRFGHGLGGLRRAVKARLQFWAAERSLRLLSDRSLADIGIPRHAIRDVLRTGQRPASEPAFSSAPAFAAHRPLAQRIELWRERQNRRQRITRELEAYSDRDLEELGIFRSDIPRLAKQAA